MRHSGFTLIELLIVMAIMGLIVACAWSVYFMSMNAWEIGGGQLVIQQEARSAMEQMIRGPGGRHGIREGKGASLNLISSDHLEVAVDMNDPPTPNPFDDTTIGIYRNGAQLIFDPNTAIANNEVILTEHLRTAVPGLAIVVNGVTVTMVLNMHNVVNRKHVDLELSSQIIVRN
jgi:prepilin-type N-terminal cleavage/methylation domain-containing protein